MSVSFYGHSKKSIDKIESGQKEYIEQFRDLESSYNFQYMVHAVLCEIAFKQGGYEKVKALYLCNADNEDEFYNCIEELLTLKRKEINFSIRDYLNQ